MKKYKRAITYGTFDLFHIGHVRLLQRISDLAEEVYVAVSSDEFNNLKNKVCIIPFEERIEIVKAIVTKNANAVQLICIVIIGGLLIARHHANIKRLLNGTENKLGAKKGE